MSMHAKNEWTFSRDSRNYLFQALKMAYMSILRENLPIFGIAKSKQLADFCTSQKDVSRGISRMPLILARIYEEDTKMPSKSKTPNFKISPNSQSKVEMSEAEKLIENLTKNFEHRNNAQRNSISIQKDINRKSIGQDNALDSDFNFDDLQ